MSGGSAESFNGHLRDDCLTEHLFPTLRYTRHLVAACREAHKPHRPHPRLDALTPREYYQSSEEGQT